MGQPLPDPSLRESPGECPGCGYSLAGLPSPGVCPECRTPFGGRNLVLCGVPKSGGGPAWRRVAWFIVLAIGAVFFNFVFLLAFLSWEIAVVGGLVYVGAIIWLLVTSPRERRGPERFIIGVAGIGRVPLRERQGATDSILIPWSGSDEVEFTRISAVWWRLRIGPPSASGRITPARFEAGVRCPDNRAQEVEETLRVLAAGGPPPD